MEENSAEIKLRVPSARFDEVRGKLRDLAVRVRQDRRSMSTFCNLRGERMWQIIPELKPGKTRDASGRDNQGHAA